MKYGINTSVFRPEKLSKHNIDRISTGLIPKNSKILEIGCATGFMGEYFIAKKNCKVYGVELGKDEAEIAKTKLTKVIVGDIENKETISKVKKLGKFDVIFATALIEHLKDPWSALSVWKTWLNPGGCIILSTSNIAHWSTRLKILKGEFNYSEYGILDNTHLHLFTVSSFKKIIEDSGLVIDFFGIDAEGGGYPKISMLGSKFLPNLFAYQMVIKAHK